MSIPGFVPSDVTDADKSFSPLAPGEKLGKFEVVRLLGTGGMGSVYLARDPHLQREVAIKVVQKNLQSGHVNLLRFLSEARAAGQLNHPHVISVYGVEENESGTLLVMEYVRGGGIADHLSQYQKFEVLNATKIIADACSGLDAAHAVGLIHRDVKPANLMLDENGNAKIGDFGLVREFHSSSSNLTQEGTIVGTPFYMSPEQCTGQPLDYRSDIYSLGATYFTMLTGASPYEKAGSAMQVILAHVHEPLPDLKKVAPDLPPAVGRIIAKAMAKLPDDRYQSCQEMELDLRAVIAMLKDKSSGQVLRYRGNVVNSREMLVLPSEKPDAVHTVVRPRRQVSIHSGLINSPSVPDSKTQILESTSGESIQKRSASKGGRSSSPEPSAYSLRSTAEESRSTMNASLNSSQHTRQDVFALQRGEVVITWPCEIEAEDLEDLSAWFDVIKRKLGRRHKSRALAAVEVEQNQTPDQQKS